jgi:hypothetical protein
LVGWPADESFCARFVKPVSIELLTAIDSSLTQGGITAERDAAPHLPPPALRGEDNSAKSVSTTRGSDTLEQLAWRSLEDGGRG